MEGLQLIVALLGLCMTFAAALTLHSLRAITIWNAMSLLLCVMCYVFAICAVDIIENVVVLRRIYHPVQPQTFVLTRKLLRPKIASIWKRFKHKLCRIHLPRDGGLIILASRELGLQRVQRVVEVRRVWVGVMTGMKKPRICGPQVMLQSRRYSFPDEQLDTGSLFLLPSSCATLPARKNAIDAAPVTPPIRGAPPSTTHVKDGNNSNVRTLVGKIEGTTAHPQRVSHRRVGDQGSPVDSAMGIPGSKRSASREGVARAHVAPRWRPADGKIK